EAVPVALTSCASAESSGAAIADVARPKLAAAATATDAAVRPVRRARDGDEPLPTFLCSEPPYWWLDFENIIIPLHSHHRGFHGDHETDGSHHSQVHVALEIIEGTLFTFHLLLIDTSREFASWRLREAVSDRARQCPALQELVGFRGYGSVRRQ